MRVELEDLQHEAGGTLPTHFRAELFIKNGLTRLKEVGFRLFAFSNGTADAVDGLLVAAGIRGHFSGNAC